MKFEDLEVGEIYLIEKSPELYLSDIGWTNVENMIVMFKDKRKLYYQDFSTRHVKEAYICRFWRILGTENSEPANYKPTIEFMINERDIQALENGELVFTKL